MKLLGANDDMNGGRGPPMKSEQHSYQTEQHSAAVGMYFYLFFQFN